jgi:glutathione S-transferase
LPGGLRRDAFGLRQSPFRPADELKALHAGFKVWTGAQADIERGTAIWRDCLQRYGRPYLFGTAPTVADAMYAPVCTRFATYDVKLDPASSGYRDLILRWMPMVEWGPAARTEPEEVEELDVEF